eukprot:3484234-Prymnesium_polylepis.1
MASLREVAAVVGAEMATAAREIERAREQYESRSPVCRLWRGEHPQRRVVGCRIGVCFTA